MADEEADKEEGAKTNTIKTILFLRERLQQLETELTNGVEFPVRSTAEFCQKFCEVIAEFAAQWKEDDPLSLLEVYTEAILSYVGATPYLSFECENVSLILEQLTLSCVELLLTQTELVPCAQWERFQSSVQTSHSLLKQKGNSQLSMLCALSLERGVWTNSTLCGILSNDSLQAEKVHEFLALEGPLLLELRVKRLRNDGSLEKAALLAKQCVEYAEFKGRGNFTQMYLLCLCAAEPQEQLMQKISEVDCKDVLEMVCNLESDGDERGALSLCSAFLTRQLLLGDVYCAWELTLLLSKLLKRLEPSEQAFLDHCRHLSRLSKNVYHILFLIKVVQAELQDEGLPVCIEMCIQGLQMASNDEGNVQAIICKTVSCLLPTDLEVKRACKLTEFLMEPSVESYYAVEAAYNEPDQKLDESNSLVPYSLRCELLLVLKTQWPFDPEFWDWKALKQHCVVLMGEQSSIVSSVDKLNDNRNLDEFDAKGSKTNQFKDPTNCFIDTTNQLNEIEDERQKKREIKKLREKGFISGRFRNWQAYVQYCVLCDKEFLGHRIVRHAQKHYHDGIYCCPICAANFDSKDRFIPHVALHVKQSCSERLAAMKTSRVLATSKKNNCNPAFEQKPESVIGAFEVEQGMEHICPVTNCQKRFKFFTNLMAHVKTHGGNEEAKCFLEIQSKKVMCNFCRRQFVSIAHLNDHLQMHCSDKPYMCVQLNCKARFPSSTELAMHRKEHIVFRAKCMFPNCGKIFTEAYMLYDHEARHYNTFTCKVSGCGRIFHSKSQLDLHQEDHITKHMFGTEQQTLVSLDMKAGPPAEILPNSKLDNPSMNIASANYEDHCCSTVQPVSSVVTNEMMSQQVNSLKVRHSVESILSPDNMSPQKVEQDISSHGNSAVEPHNSNSNQFKPQSSGNTDISYSKQAESDNIPSLELIQIGLHGQTCTLNQNLQTPITPDAQNSVSLSMSEAINRDTLATPQDWSCSDNSLRDSQDPKLYSCELHRPVSLCNFSGESEPHESSIQVAKHENADSFDYSSSQPANLSCTFNENKVVQQIHSPTSNLNFSVHESAEKVDSTRPSLVLVVEGKTSDNFDHPFSSGSAAPVVAKARHYCLFETCSRNYSCTKSANKHMRTAHPEFYVQWKLAKQNSKVLNAITRTQPLRRNKASPDHQMHPTSCRNPPACPGRLSGNVVNTVFPSQPGQSQSKAAVIHTRAMQADIGSGPHQPVSAGNLSDISTQPAHAIEYLPKELKPLASQFLSSEMDKAYPSEMGSANVSGKVNRICNRISVENETSAAPIASSFERSEICTGKRQNEIQTIADPNFGFKQVDHVDSEVTFASFDEDSSLNNSASAVEPTDGKSIDPVLLSGMEEESDLPGLLLSEISCLSPLHTSTSPEAPFQKRDEGLGNGTLSSHPISPNKYAMRLSMLVPSDKNVSQLAVPSSLLIDGAKGILGGQVGNLTSSVLSSQLPSSSSSGVVSSERMTRSQMSLPTTREAILSKVGVDSEEKSNSSDQDPNLRIKKVKRDKRSKWPAIIKDGKYICSRCFREFRSSKSLGGHLSKRSQCKDLNQVRLNERSSLLHGQRSPLSRNVQILSAAPNVNPDMHGENHLGQSFRHAADPDFAHCVTSRKTLPSVCETRKAGESPQIFLDKLPMQSQTILESTQMVHSTFHKLGELFSADDCLPESTVMQHTRTPEKTYGEVDFIRSEVSHLDHKNFTQPLQIQNASLDNCCDPSLHLNEILRAEPLRKISVLKENSGKSQGFGPSDDSLLAAIASLAQNLTRDPSQHIALPDAQQQIPSLTGPPDLIQKETCNESVKKKCQDQTLAGDIACRGKFCQETVTHASTCQEMVANLHVEDESHGFCSSMEIHENDSKPKAQPVSGRTFTAPIPQSNGILPLQSCTEQAEGSSVVCGKLPKELMSTHESKSPILPADDEKVREILKALQRLDLGQETMDDQSPVDLCSTLNVSVCDEKFPLVVQSPKPSAVDGTNGTDNLGNISKPFLCMREGCKYGAMTKESLFKHLVRVHDYTNDMIIKLKKGPAKFAPYCCHLCTKTFTRTTNLRIHCEGIHKLSRKEFAKHKVRFLSNKKANEDISESKLSNNLTGTYPSNSQKVWLSYATSPIISQEKLHSASELNAVHEQKAISQERVSDSLANVQSASAANRCLERQLGGPAKKSMTMAASASHQVVPSRAVNSFPEKIAEVESPQKTKVKKEKNEIEDAFNPYRPYRCVHEGCVASFTIQQNLILHYKAVHQSALPKFGIHSWYDRREDVGQEGEFEMARSNEFHCQVQDCSRIFPQVGSLVQHYLQLHEFSMDRTEAFMSNINFQEFQCDQPDCTSYFSDFRSYTEHIKEDHKMVKMSKTGKIEETFQCEYDGCDRVYSTRSNVVRHIMNKHQDFYKLLMKKQKRPERVDRVTRKTKDTGDRTHAGKENRDDQNHRQKGSNKKQNSRSRSHWTCFGKPSLKSLDEASGMCTKKFALQYPCMLKGCDSVMSSERSVLRHYASHGLTERYIEEQRSCFIFCKKYSRSRLRDSESEDDAPETSEDDEDEMGAKEQGTGRSKRIYRKVGSPKLPAIKQLSNKITENKSVETVVIKRKRGRPRKVDNTETKIVAPGRRSKSLRNTANKVSQVANRACIRVVHTPTGQPEKTLPLSSFKPLGFEMSFLQFLEKSAEPTLSEKRKASKTLLNEIPSKRCRTLQQRPVNIICDGPNLHRHAKYEESLVEFRNPLKLKSVKNVKIVVDGTFSSSADLLLKQLQEMRPMVILRKWLYS